MIDPNLTKWINASVNKYYSDNSNPYPFYVGGHEGSIPTDGMWVEIFFSSGPNTEEKSKNDFHTTLTLTIMCVATLTVPNEYSIHDMVGKFENLASVDIPVMRLGNNPQDNESFVGCLQLQGGTKKQQWGVIDRGIQGKARQISVEVDYLMSFSL